MNYELTIKNIKGKEEQVLIIEPSSQLEEQFFNSIFFGEMVAVAIPNSKKIVIQQKPKLKDDDEEKERDTTPSS